MTLEWITDRLPTEADADEHGDVNIMKFLDSKPPGLWYKYWAVVALGQPWWSEKAAQRVEPEHRFAVGQLWRRRDGEVERVTKVDPGADFPVYTDKGYWHRADGTSCINCSDDDLIEIVSGPEPAPAPARKVVQIAVGVELLALCEDGTMWAMKTNGGPWTQVRAIPQPDA